MEKKDLNGYRTPEDVARRYKLGDIKLNTEDIEALKNISTIDDQFSTTSEHALQNKVITTTFNNISGVLQSKVDKETGKGLSTNDYTDEDKEKVDNAITVISNATAYTVGGIKIYMDANNNLYITNDGTSPIPN